MIRLVGLPLAVAAGLLAYVFASIAFAHDHDRPELNGWYQSLSSKNGPCCDGPKTDALHLQDADWDSKDGHYRVRVPRNSEDFKRAIHGESVETEWVDVPASAVIDEPNRAGVTLVWPLYGYMGNTIRCFMPGPLA